MTRVTSPRRRERPRRLVAAVVLLILSTVAVGSARLIGSAEALAAAGVASVVLAGVAARLGHDELVDERRTHAEERAVQAGAFRSLFLERSAEHALFASRMRNRLLAADRLVSDTRGLLRLAGARGDEAEARARAERGRAVAAESRVAELEVELATSRAEVIDELAAWEVVPGLEVDTVVDLLSWEERASAPRIVEQRKHA